jgi:hypothetical protein
MERAKLIEKIEGVRRLMDAPLISKSFRRTHVIDQSMSIYDDAIGTRGFVGRMTQASFIMAVENNLNTPDQVADRLLEALEHYDER